MTNWARSDGVHPRAVRRRRVAGRIPAAAQNVHPAVNFEDGETEFGQLKVPQFAAKALFEALLAA